MSECSVLSNVFLQQRRTACVFFFELFTRWGTSIAFWKLHWPPAPGIEHTWLYCSIPFIRCWIWFPSYFVEGFMSAIMGNIVCSVLFLNRLCLILLSRECWPPKMRWEVFVPLLFSGRDFVELTFLFLKIGRICQWNHLGLEFYFYYFLKIWEAERQRLLGSDSSSAGLLRQVPTSTGAGPGRTQARPHRWVSGTQLPEPSLLPRCLTWSASPGSWTSGLGLELNPGLNCRMWQS